MDKGGPWRSLLQEVGLVIEYAMALLAAAMTAGATPAAAKVEAKAAAQSSPQVRIYAYWFRAGGAAGHLRAAAPLTPPESWFRDADYPADARRTFQSGRTTVDATISEAGDVVACEPADGAPADAFSAASCAAILARGRFRHALDGAGAPTGAPVRLSIYFEALPPGKARTPLSPAPPPPGLVNGKEISYSATSFVIVEQPDWKAAPGRKKTWSGVAIVGLQFSAEGNVSACETIQSSGDDAIDSGTCAAASAGRYASRSRFGPFPGDKPVPLRVEWVRGRAAALLPVQYQNTPPVPVAGARLAPADLPAEVLRDPQWTRVGAIVAVSAAGAPLACVIEGSTGDDGHDVALCRHILAEVRFTPGRDVFGKTAPLPTRLSPLRPAP